MNLSEIIGSALVSQEGAELGYVYGILLNKTRTKLAALLCADGDENEFYLPARAMLSAGDVIVCTDLRAIEVEGKTSPLGLSVYSDRGLSLGVVYDMAFEDDGAYLILSDGARYPAARARFGQVVIVRSDSPVRKQSGAKEKAAPASSPLSSPAPAPAIAPPPASEQQKTPTASEFNRLNLLGRRVRKTVYASSGETVAIAGEKITPEILSRARRENRLIQLTVNTFTNLA